jgi:hypothetical protein
MFAAVSRKKLGIVLISLSVVLLAACWWYLQRSACAGNLKQGYGDIESALDLERRAFVACVLAILTLFTGITISTKALPLWVEVVLGILSFPVGCIAFLALSFADGHAGWICSL